MREAGFPSSDWVRRGTTADQLGDAAIIGVTVWYADGSVIELPDLNGWDQIPNDGVLLVAAYSERTYRSGDDERNYRALLHSQPYYWLDGDGLGCGPARDVPDGAMVKTGAAVDDDTWRAVYALAHEAHSWPSK